MDRSRLLHVAMAGLLLGSACTAQQHQPQPVIQPGLIDGWYRVVDGDTIIIDNVGRVRFSDRDAPELDEPGGREARHSLRDGMPVRGKKRRRPGGLQNHEARKAGEWSTLCNTTWTK